MNPATPAAHDARQLAATLTWSQEMIVAQRGIAYGNCPYDASVIRPLGRIGLFKRVTMRGFRDRWMLTKRGEAVRKIILDDA